MTKEHDIELDDLPQSVRTHIEHLERVRQDFVANVSHELRTPLTVIRGYLETLTSQELPDKKVMQKILTQMYQHSMRMENIIEDLLLLSRLEREEEQEIQQSLEISKLLHTLREEALSYSGDKNHQIILEADDKVKLTGNEDELKSLFSNIIINAVKYTPAKGKIFIKWYSNNDRAALEVSDTGIGIDKKHLPRITERFYRVDKARSRDSGGTGLGLAIAKHVLLRHHAELTIDSELGKGSTFTCLFPKNRSNVIKTS